VGPSKWTLWPIDPKHSPKQAVWARMSCMKFELDWPKATHDIVRKLISWKAISIRQLGQGCPVWNLSLIDLKRELKWLCGNEIRKDGITIFPSDLRWWHSEDIGALLLTIVIPLLLNWIDGGHDLLFLMTS